MNYMLQKQSIKNQFDRLEANLNRIQDHNECFHQPYSFSTPYTTNYKQWLDKILLPQTRLIVEPKIAGAAIVLTYKGGLLFKAINKAGLNKIQNISEIKNIPFQLPIKKDIQIRGVLYAPNLDSFSSEHLADNFLSMKTSTEEELNFCSFQIFNSNQNQYQSLKELQKLGLEVPDTEFTNFTSEVELYVQLWREGKLFANYPTEGIVLKVNSRKFQKQLRAKNDIMHSNWCYVMNNSK